MSGTEPTEKRKRLSNAERRQEFITKAIAFFAEEGFESSTRGLAKQLGVTQPLLYRYFPSKQDLISEVYEAVYVNRWQDEWTVLIRDRSVPLQDRLNKFYNLYTDVIFNREWLRIYLFSGLKGVDINRRYMRLVRQRILEPILEEARAEAGYPQRPATKDEVEFSWVMHGGIFYYGVRDLIYESCVSGNKAEVIKDAIAAFQAGMAIKFAEGSPTQGEEAT